MKTRDPKDELSLLIDRAQRLAASRHERLSTIHLLRAVLIDTGHAHAVLAAHQVSEARVAELTAAPEPPELPRQIVDAARELSQRMVALAPSGTHLLVALLGERATSAYRALASLGVDIGRLRTAAMQLLLGAPPLRKVAAAPSQAPAPRSGPTPSAPERPRARAPLATAVAVSLVPRLDAKARVGRSAPTPSEPELATRAPEPSLRRVTADDPSPTGHEASPADLAPSDRALAGRATSDDRATPIHEPPPRHRASTARQLELPGTTTRARAPSAREGRAVLDPKQFPVLSAVGKNLSLVEENAADPIVGREAEIERCLDVLARRRANSPLLVGAHGIGKTSIVRGVARAMLAARAGSLDDRLLVALGPAELTEGLAGRGAITERFQAIARELAAVPGRVVLVVEDVHALVAGTLEEELGAELRAALAAGAVQILGTSTPDDVRRAIEADPQLARRFSPILVEEPTRDEAREVIDAAVLAYARHHQVRFPSESLSGAIEWTVRYMPGRSLPDKALSVLDLAGARARRRGADRVELAEVAEVVAELTDVPATRLLETDGERMLNLEALLGDDVVGHDTELRKIAAILRRNAAGIRGKRPIGSFLLLGPTGVGKTETAKAVARALFHDTGAMTRLDLSEFAEPHAIARLIGAPPGYVGHESGGQLTEAVRKRPYQVILLDEIEKAHRDVLLAFLQVLDEGHMTDGRGRTVDFTNTVIMMTSNLGASEAVRVVERTIGFRAGGTAVAEPRLDEAAVAAAARRALAPELYNRIDEVLVFPPLTVDDVRKIAEKLLGALSRQVEAERGVSLEVDPEVLDALVAKGGFDPQLGARPMRRAIAKHVETKLAELLLRDEAGEGDRVRVRVGDDGEIVLVTPKGARGAA